MKKILFSILLLIFAFAGAQDLVDMIAPFYSYDFDNEHYNSTYPYSYPVRNSALNTGNPLSVALGGATVAAGPMAPELTVNPASLAMSKYNIIQVNGLFNQYNNVNQNSFAGASYIVSLPVYRGSLNFAGGITREKDYHLYYQTDDIIQRSTGGLYNWRFASAIEIQKDIFVGAEVSLLSGKRNNDINFKNALPSETAGFIENNKYFGIGARIGMNYHFLPVLMAGISLDLPTSLGVSYNLRLYDVAGSSGVDYTVKSPAVFRAGLALTLKLIDLYYSFDYANWQNLTVRSSDLTQVAVDALNHEVLNNFGITQAHHFGMALHVPLLPLHFYLGYQYLPDIYQGLNAFRLGNLVPDQLTDRFRSCFSWGASFFLKQGLCIAAACECYHV
ncbi:MAG: hypothetical protein RBT66_02010 [bacterium]|jgi:hypothetical protein|nr:hypothetical protein [bacterium]